MLFENDVENRIDKMLEKIHQPYTKSCGKFPYKTRTSEHSY